LPPLLFIAGDEEVLRDEIIHTLVSPHYFMLTDRRLDLVLTKLRILKSTRFFRVPFYYVLIYKMLKSAKISLPRCIYRFMMVECIVSSQERSAANNS
jgi:hypothetical protein